MAQLATSLLVLSLCVSSSLSRATRADPHVTERKHSFRPAPRDAHLELDEAAKEFWHVPVSFSEDCNIETIECRGRGVHWEASPPAFIIVSRSGDVQRARGVLSTCLPDGEGEESESGRAGRGRRFFVLTSASEEEARLIAPQELEAHVTFVGVDEASLSSPSHLLDAILTLVHLHLPSSTKRLFLLNAPCSAAVHAMIAAPSYANPLLLAEAGAAVGGIPRAVLEMLEAVKEEVEGGDEGWGEAMEGVMGLAAMYMSETAMEGGGWQRQKERTEKQQGVSGAEEGGEQQQQLPQQVVVASVVFSQPRMLQYQLQTMKRHLLPSSPPPLLLAIVDTSDAALQQAFERVCRAEGAECVGTPAHAWTSRGSRASWLHGQALEWAWEEVLLPRFPRALLLITEQDVFLLRPFDLLAALDPRLAAPSPLPPDAEPERARGGACSARCSMGGVSQVRRNEEGWPVEYLHPSAIVLDMRRLPTPAAVRFSPVEFNGTELDTGGSLAMYWEAARDAEEAEAEEDGGGSGRCLRVCRLAHRYAAPDTCFWRTKQELGLPDVYAESILHAQKSSGWDIRSVQEHGRDWERERRLRKSHEERAQCLWDTLDEAIQSP